MADAWNEVAQQICATLGDGLDVLGVVEAADVFVRIGSTCLEVVVEACDLVGEEQGDAYRVLCDLLDTRLAGTADEVAGFLLIETEPSAHALLIGLSHMERSTGIFVPILPLSQSQARAMADASSRFADLVDEARALLRRALDRKPPTIENARLTLLEIDELIERSCNN